MVETPSALVKRKPPRRSPFHRWRDWGGATHARSLVAYSFQNI
jgi:hypothetical protein